MRQAKQAHGQARAEHEEARRQLLQATTATWNQLQSLQDVIVARKEEVLATTLALEGVEDEASVGARTVLDVLDAEQEFLQAEVELITAQRDIQVVAYTVLALMGRLTPPALQVPVSTYDPDVYADGAASVLWGVSTK